MSDLELYKILENFNNLDSAGTYKAYAGDVNDDSSENLVNDIAEFIERFMTDVAAEYSPEEIASVIRQVISQNQDDGTIDTDMLVTIQELANEVKAALEAQVHEDTTQIQKQGNKVIVTKDGDRTEFDSEDTATAFMGGDDKNQFTTEAFGAYDDYVDEDVVENEPELETFDAENPLHRKRLQRGTPVVLSAELFKDPNCDRRGIFISMSPSGHFGKVLRRFDGKEGNVHLTDIISADIRNNSVYESFNSAVDLMITEEITVTQTQNAENPENNTVTVTAIGNNSVDELLAIMANAGVTQQSAEAVDTGVPVMPTVEFSTESVDDLSVDPDERSGVIFHKLHNVIQSAATPDQFAVAERYANQFIEYLVQEARKARDFDNTERLRSIVREIYADLNAKQAEIFGVQEDRDINHANTPNEMEFGTDTMVNAISGGLNGRKRQFKKEYPGDNPMTVTEAELTEKAPPGMEDWIVAHKKEFQDQYGDRWEEVLYATAWKEHNKQNENATVSEDVDSFLNLYKVFQGR